MFESLPSHGLRFARPLGYRHVRALREVENPLPVSRLEVSIAQRVDASDELLAGHLGGLVRLEPPRRDLVSVCVAHSQDQPMVLDYLRCGAEHGPETVLNHDMRRYSLVRSRRRPRTTTV